MPIDDLDASAGGVGVGTAVDNSVLHEKTCIRHWADDTGFQASNVPGLAAKLGR